MILLNILVILVFSLILGYGVNQLLDGKWKSVVNAAWEHAKQIPLKKLHADDARIKELQEWNTSWSHPEIGDFYMWDGTSYVETSWKKTDSGTVRGYQAESYEYTPGPGVTMGSWCRSCKSSAHGAEYCRRCVDNYGYREGKKRYKLPNGCYVDTYEETLCEVCKEPLPLYWSRICSAECGRKLEETHCKDTMCDGYGTVYLGGLCKGCYEVRMKERTEIEVRLFSADGVNYSTTETRISTARDVLWSKRVLSGEDAALYEVVQHLLRPRGMVALKRLPVPTQNAILDKIHGLMES